MSRSTDPGHFFQTETSLEEIQRKAAKSSNTSGNPIKLPSKILAVIEDPAHTGCVYIAESAGTARRVALDTGKTSHIFRGPTAPLTCVALGDNDLVAGCWDKTIWRWDANTRKPKRQLVGHWDFVKALLVIVAGGERLLLSGGADALIIVWNLRTGERLHTLKGPARGIEDLAADPASFAEGGRPARAIVFSAGSDPEIRRWSVSASDAAEVDGGSPILEHDTSVYKLQFDADDDLWTASADNTARCLNRERGWKTDTTLKHPDFVRAVVVDDVGGWVVTACRDEDVRVWNKSTGELHHSFTGHFEEVTDLVLVGRTVVSVSIDGTVRQWSLKPDDLREAIAEAEEAMKGQAQEEAEPQETSVLTADEERELTELLDDGD